MSENETKKTISGMKILLAVLLVIVLLNAALVLFNLLSGRPLYALPAREGNSQAASDEYELFGPDDYTVNLADSGQRRYLKVRLVLAYEEKKLLAELNRRQAQIRDLIILTLRQHTAEDLAGSGGLEALRGELKNKVNSVLRTGVVREIYFIDFLVQ
ncbi:MAG TPA: flagellar basal body-associated FliL family protein [Firmicutes bacterium]|nr:flagellar basal body-associated FliL family protein [Bacillota bacterium]